MSKRRQQKGKKKPEYDWGDSDGEGVGASAAAPVSAAAARKGGAGRRAPANAFDLLNAGGGSSGSDSDSSVESIPQPVKRGGKRRPAAPVNAFSMLGGSDDDSDSSVEEVPVAAKSRGKAVKGKKPKGKVESDSEASSVEEVPVPAKSKGKAKGKKPKFEPESDSEASSVDEVPVKAKGKAPKGKGKKSKGKIESDSDSEASSVEEEVPVPVKAKSKAKAKGKKPKFEPESDSETSSVDEVPVKSKSKGKAKGRKSKSPIESESEASSVEQVPVKPKSKGKTKGKKSKVEPETESEASSAEEAPVKAKSKGKAKLEPESDSETESIPVQPKSKSKSKSKAKGAKPKAAESEDSAEEDGPAETKSKSKKSKSKTADSDDEPADATSKKAKKSKKAKGEGDDEDEEERRRRKEAKRAKKAAKAAAAAGDEDAAEAERRRQEKKARKKAKAALEAAAEGADDAEKPKSKGKQAEEDDALVEAVEQLQLDNPASSAAPSDSETPANQPAKPRKRQGKYRPDKEAQRIAAANADSGESLGEASSSAQTPAATPPPQEPPKATTAAPKPSTAGPRTFVDSEETSGGANLSRVEFKKGSSAIPTEVLDLRFRRPSYADTSAVAVAGTLVSDRNSRDVQVDKFTLQAYGRTLVKEGSLNLLHGRKYGLIGANGCGKSTLLQSIAWGEVPLPRMVDVYLLDREYDATDQTAVEAVLDIVVKEKEQLEADMEELLEQPNGQEDPKFEYIMDRLAELDMSGSEVRAGDILHGLGFDEEMCGMQTREFSGGWRMRIALARALFVKPTLLLLDDPSNHLDLGAVVWLEDYLEAYDSTILMVSHSQDFLNGVCTDTIHMQSGQLDYYSGPYDSFVRARQERDQNLAKRARQEERALNKMKEAAGRSGTAGTKLVKTKEKALAKKLERTGGSALEELDTQRARPLVIRFNECGGGLAPPLIALRDVAFGYPGRAQLFRDLNLGVDLDSRVALVGPNGAGKSTLMKLLAGVLQPTEGEVTFRNGLRIARFHQHLTEQLNLEQSAVAWMMHEFPLENYKEHFLRLVLGRFGLTGKHQVVPMRQLSDGQRRRVIFAWLSMRTPHLLFLDEPSNHLDLETIDALAEGLQHFDGGVVLVSHDFRLIDQVCNEIWVVEEGRVDRWDGSIHDYKKFLRQRVLQSGLGR